MENNDTRFVWGYNTNSSRVLIVKAVAKDGIMVDINTFENNQKNSEGACWVNFEMTMTGRERGKEGGSERRKVSDRERERERGREGEREWERDALDNSLFESFESSSWGFFDRGIINT